MIRRNVIRTCAFRWIFCGFNLSMIYGSLNGVSDFFPVVVSDRVSTVIIMILRNSSSSTSKEVRNFIKSVVISSTVVLYEGGSSEFNQINSCVQCQMLHLKTLINSNPPPPQKGGCLIFVVFCSLQCLLEVLTVAVVIIFLFHFVTKCYAIEQHLCCLEF